MRKYSRGILARMLVLCCASLLALGTAHAQSTFGTILGTVSDSTGAILPGTSVTLTNSGTASKRIVTTDGEGNFTFSNVEVGSYSLTVSAAGFEKTSLSGIALTARETRHIPITLKAGATSEVVEVTAPLENVITTEVSNLAVTKTGDELTSLPVAIYSHSTGSTSPISTLTTEAGVQTDDSGNLVIMGTTPALMSVTIDGISSVNVEYSGAVNEMFPSFNSIEEIRVSESNNNAEFSGVADITTISKAGTNKFHGGVFENHENSAFNSGFPLEIATSKPKIVMNDFGGTLGGPIVVPHIFNGHNKAFFFISYEGLRLPHQSPVTTTVPTDAMRSGNVENYLSQLYGSGYQVYDASGNALNEQSVPVNSISANIISTLMPHANFGSTGAISDNFQENFDTPISSNQGDVRVDYTINSKQSLFARFTYKNRQTSTAPDPNCGFGYCQAGGSPMLGGFNTPEIDEGLTFAHNFIITQHLLNEFRGGFNTYHSSTSQMTNFTSEQLLQETGITAVATPNPWPSVPQVIINNFMTTGGGNPTKQRSEIVQLLDNVTWTKGSHTMKFGGDWKRMTDHDDNVFGSQRSGQYAFDSSSNVGSAIGDPYTSFLLGLPDWTELATVNKPAMDGLGYSWAFFGQDDWKIRPNLTLNLGLRWELHPPLKEINYNTAFFDPSWSSSVNGENVTGAVVVPNQTAVGFSSQDFANSISPMPILTAAQAGLPEGLRYTDKNDWGPRLGFAWRPFNNDKTVLRGGWGRFMETPLGFSLVSGWAVSASYVGVFSQDYDSSGNPDLSFQSPFPNGGTITANSGSTGTAGFYYAFPIHYKDPSVQQWNLTLEQDLGHSIGMRFSYTGSHGSNLETMVDLNQVQANTIGYNNPAPAALSSNTGCVASSANPDIPNAGVNIGDERPFPCFSVIQSVINGAESNYDSATVAVSKHAGHLQFDSSYIWTRDLSNAAGMVPTSFASAGGTWATDRFHLGRDYGNVMYDRKHRFMTTYLYDLPFGHGQRWANTAGLLNYLVGNWTFSGVVVLQSGPYLTPYQESVDSANTNILTTVGMSRPDQIAGVSPYAQRRTTANWLNASAFSYQNLQTTDSSGNTIGIGRFGSAPVGGFVGPGTSNFSMSLSKGFKIYAESHFQLGVAAANVFNHRNYEPPNTQVDSPSFGQITGLQTAEGSGPRSLQLTGRITF